MLNSDMAQYDVAAAHAAGTSVPLTLNACIAELDRAIEPASRLFESATRFR